MAYLWRPSVVDEETSVTALLVLAPDDARDKGLSGLKASRPDGDERLPLPACLRG